MNCKLCNSNTSEIIDDQFNQVYYKCDNCELVFSDEDNLLCGVDELDQYNRHENSLENEGYVNMFENFLDYCLEGTDFKKGLDFGSGPTPVLKELLQRRGYEIDIYDVFYARNDIFNNKYDFITSTEVFEHFFDPKSEIDRIVKMMKPGSYLCIMTLFLNDDIDFQKWWYRRDPTHVTFYNISTFNYIAKKYNLEIVKINSKNIVVFQKM